MSSGTERQNARRGRAQITAVGDFLERAALVLALVALTVIVVVVCFQVIARYIVGLSTGWAPDLAQLSFVWLALLAVAIGVRANEHIVLDVWGKVSHGGLRTLLSSVTSAIVVLVCVVVVWYAVTSLPTVFQRRMPGLGISAGWMYLAVPVGFGLSLVFALEKWWDAIRPGQGVTPETEDDADRADLADVKEGTGTWVG